MKVHNRVFTGELTNREIEKYIRRISANKSIYDEAYVITVPLWKDGILNIYDYDELLKKEYKTIADDIDVVGIAKTYEDAMRVLEDIVEAMLKAQGEIDVCKYFG